MRASTPSIRLVCLDLGGVLVRICSGWEQACQRASLPMPRKLQQDSAVCSRLVQISHAHEMGRLSDQAFADQAGQLLEVPPHEVMAVVDAWLLGAYPGAFELVGQLAAQSVVPVACLSNTNSRHWQMMNQAGPSDLGLGRLHHRFTSFDIGAMKPDPAIYRHVEKTLGIQPDSGTGTVLFFDDNADNIDSARRGGWLAHRIDPAADPVTQVREHLIRYHVL